MVFLPDSTVCLFSLAPTTTNTAQMNSLILNFYSIFTDLPIRMCEMSFTKLKTVYHNMCKALDIQLCSTATKMRMLYIGKVSV